MNGGLIFGRSPNLVLGFLLAVWNVIVLALNSQGTELDATLVAAVNILIGAFVALIANSATIQVAAGDAAKARQS